MTQQDKRSMMFNMVERWRQSGLSQIEFSRIHSIGSRKLQYWIRKHAHNEDNESGFIQLKGLSSSSISIRYPNGIELHLPSQTPVGYIKMLVSI